MEKASQGHSSQRTPQVRTRPWKWLKPVVDNLNSKRRLPGSSQHQQGEAGSKVGKIQEARSWGRTNCGQSWSHLCLLAPQPPGYVLICPWPLDITHSTITVLGQSMGWAEHGLLTHAQGTQAPSLPVGEADLSLPAAPQIGRVFEYQVSREDKDLLYTLDLSYLAWFPQEPWEGGKAGLTRHLTNKETEAQIPS